MITPKSSKIFYFILKVLLYCERQQKIQKKKSKNERKQIRANSQEL